MIFLVPRLGDVICLEDIVFVVHFGDPPQKKIPIENSFSDVDIIYKLHGSHGFFVVHFALGIQSPQLRMVFYGT